MVRDMDEGRRGTWPCHERLHDILKSGSAQRGDTARESGPPSPGGEDDKDDDDVEHTDERREPDRAEGAQGDVEPGSGHALHGPGDGEIDGIIRDMMRGNGKEHAGKGGSETGDARAKIPRVTRQRTPPWAFPRRGRPLADPHGAAARKAPRPPAP